MKRLALLRNQLHSSDCKNKSNSKQNKNTEQNTKIMDSAIHYFDYYEFLTNEERDYVAKLREFLEKNIRPNLEKYVEKAETPIELIKKIVEHFPGIWSFSMKGYSCAGFSVWLSSAILYEFARCDASITTFMLVHGAELGMQSIYMLGSEEQKKFFLPKMNKGELIGCFCLTEPNYGSDATSLKTEAKEDENGDYIINGEKRWIGNATFADVFIIWARNVKTKKIEGFIAEKSVTSGITTEKIEGKLSLRMVENANIKFNNVKIKKDRKLPLAQDFSSGVNKVLLYSRLGVAQVAVGMMIGCYDRAMEYCSKRKQFGKLLISFQITQEKLSRLLANAQAGIFMAKRAIELYIQDKLTIGQVGLVKAWCSDRLRESAGLSRELMGGNGILYENWAMLCLIDAEAIFTYEGTYDINMLACGKEITGIPAFK